MQTFRTIVLQALSLQRFATFEPRFHSWLQIARRLRTVTNQRCLAIAAQNVAIRPVASPSNLLLMARKVQNPKVSVLCFFFSQ